jgi:hypothetical protein
MGERWSNIGPWDGLGPWNTGGVGFAFLVENMLQTMQDRVSGTPVDITLTAGRPKGDDSTLAGTDEATIDSDGNLNTYGSFEQLCPYSEDTGNWTGSGPWTQSISLTNLSTYTVSTNLNGATIDITAGTATIDAPAQATYGSPDQFVVTGAGTVTITTDTADPKTQLTETAYKYPYLINTTAGSISSPLSYSDADEGYKWPINSTDTPKLFGVLDGVANGTTVLNDDFSTDTSGNYGSNDGTLLYDGTNELLKNTYTTTNANRGIFQTPLLTIGVRYDITFKAKGTRLTPFTAIETGITLGTGLLNPTLTSEWQNYHFRITATSDVLRLYQGSGSIGEYIEFDDILCTEISPAQGQLQYIWTPMFNDADVSGVINILTANDEAASFLFYDADNQLLKLFDGTNTASVALTAVSGTEYLIDINIGDNSGQKMQIGVDSVGGTLVTNVGSLPNSTDLAVAWDSADWQKVKLISAKDAPSWL